MASSPANSLLAVGWYLEEWAYSRQWARESGTTVLFFLMLGAVVVGVPFVLCAGLALL